MNKKPGDEYVKTITIPAENAMTALRKSHKPLDQYTEKAFPGKITLVDTWDIYHMMIAVADKLVDDKDKYEKNELSDVEFNQTISILCALRMNISRSLSSLIIEFAERTQSDV